MPKDYDIELYLGGGCSGSLSGGALNTSGQGYNSGTTSESITYTHSIQVSTCYYIKVYPKNTGVYDLCDSYRLEICWQPSSACLAPSNDNCANATSITSNGSCLQGTVECATGSYGANNCGNGTSPDDKDVYYKFVAQSTSHTVSVSNYASNFDAVIELRTACGTGTAISCYDPSGAPSV